MTISNQNEIKLKSGQTLSIQFSIEGNCWEVALWNEDDSNAWYKEFDNEPDAKKEFDRWKEY
jgi:hypothetical protein